MCGELETWLCTNVYLWGKRVKEEHLQQEDYWKEMPFVGTNVDKIFLLYSYYYRNNCALLLLPACLCDHI